MLNYLLIGGLIIGFGFLVGKGTHLLRITGVIGYILTGILLGPDVLNLVNLSNTEIETITNIALGFVAFIIGGELTLSTLKKTGKNIIAIIIGESLGAFLLVLIGLYLLTQNLAISIIFAAMAPASAPAGIIAVIHEYKAKGKLTNAILMVVGFDDGLAVLIYAFSMAAAGVLISGNLSVSTLLFSPLYDIGGALLVGGLLGGLFAYVLRRLNEREEIIAVSITAILLSAGFALYFGFSLILCCMIMGMMIINVYPQENKPVFDHIKTICLPIYIIFFVIAGINLHLHLLLSIGAIGIVYIICRSIGLIGGSYLGALFTKADHVIRDNIGLGILSQAGVAIGLSLLAHQKLSALGMEDIGSLVVTTVAATSVVFEIIGPLTARFALLRAKEIRAR